MTFNANKDYQTKKELLDNFSDEDFKKIAKLAKKLNEDGTESPRPLLFFLLSYLIVKIPGKPKMTKNDKRKAKLIGEAINPPLKIDDR